MRCLVAAMAVAEDHHFAKEPIEADELRYTSGNVQLLLHPRKTMTWKMWAVAIQGIWSFITRVQSVELEFDFVELEFAEAVGTGSLTVV